MNLSKLSFLIEYLMYKTGLSVEATKLIHSENQHASIPRHFQAELAALGLDWKTLKNVLPDWADTAFDSKSGLLELKTFLTKNAGLSFQNGELARKALPAVRFKTTKGTAKDEVTAARSLATACARLVARITINPKKEISRDPAEFRRLIIEQSKSGRVDLSSLLAACWAIGIPVLYLPELPTKGKKMEGMVTYVVNRPVIVLTKKAEHHPDWMLFLLAHELGHIGSGHIDTVEGEAIVDEKVGLDASTNDYEEKEANRYATHILAAAGKEVKVGVLPTAPNLAHLASEYARQRRMSPGYVVLNACHNSKAPDGTKPFALAQAALRYLPDYYNGKSASDLCREALKANICEDDLSDDSREFLEKLRVL